MRLKHKLCPAAREMNIVPGLHSTLVSVPKLVDAGYTTVFSKGGAAIYDDHTTTITADKPPILEADRCNLTGLWKLPLHAKETAAKGEPPHNEVINIPLVPCGGRIPTKRNLHQGRLQRKLCNLAQTHHQAHPQIHARFG